MELSTLETLAYGFVAGISEILPISSRAHSTLMLKILGAEKISRLPILLIHIAICIAIYSSNQIQLVKMSRARRLARIPKKKRKRPLDLRSLMDSRFLTTMILPIILILMVYREIQNVSFSLLFLAIALFINGVVLYIPQFLPGSNKDARSLSRVEGFLMGLGGTLSVLPGFSGIGAAASVGSICGVERTYALNMSLLMNMVYMIGMIIYDILNIVSFGFGALSFPLILIYLLTAFIAYIGTMLAIRIMRAMASASGYQVFAYYCWGIALFAFILNLMA